MRDNFFKKTFNYAKKNPNTFILTADLGYGLFEDFEKFLPNQFINVGSCEQNLIALASGLSSQGSKVFVYSIGNFPSLRCLEFIRNSVCYNNFDVNIISNGAGFSYGPLGFSHHAIEDIAALRSFPNLEIYNPANLKELSQNCIEIFKKKNPKYLRLGKSTKINENFKNKLNNQNKVLLITSGTILEEAIKLQKISSTEITVYSISKIKKISFKEKKKLISLIKKHKKIYTLEEHRINAGFGSIILQEFFQFIKKKDFKTLGVEDYFEKKIGNINYMRKTYKLDYKNLKKEILD